MKSKIKWLQTKDWNGMRSNDNLLLYYIDEKEHWDKMYFNSKNNIILDMHYLKRRKYEGNPFNTFFSINDIWLDAIWSNILYKGSHTLYKGGLIHNYYFYR